jgi:hypothetical protein
MLLAVNVRPSSGWMPRAWNSDAAEDALGVPAHVQIEWFFRVKARCGKGVCMFLNDVVDQK